MNRDELAQIIRKSIEELGFARIAKPAILNVFSTGEPSFDIHEKLKEFAASENLELRDEDENFWVFRRLNNE